MISRLPAGIALKWYPTGGSAVLPTTLPAHELLGLVAARAFLLVSGDSADGYPSWHFVAAALSVYRLLGRQTPRGPAGTQTRPYGASGGSAAGLLEGVFVLLSQEIGRPGCHDRLSLESNAAKSPGAINSS